MIKLNMMPDGINHLYSNASDNSGGMNSYSLTSLASVNLNVYESPADDSARVRLIHEVSIQGLTNGGDIDYSSSRDGDHELIEDAMLERVIFP